MVTPLSSGSCNEMIAIEIQGPTAAVSFVCDEVAGGMKQSTRIAQPHRHIYSACFCGWCLDNAV